jgi:hypothetical protein
MKTWVFAGVLAGLAAAVPASADAACQIAVAIHPDGALVLDGKTYSIDGPLFAKFKARAAQYYALDRDCDVHIASDPGAPPRVVGTVALTLDNLRAAAAHH